jgi:hypothetical protein
MEITLDTQNLIPAKLAMLYCTVSDRNYAHAIKSQLESLVGVEAASDMLMTAAETYDELITK